MAAGVENPPIYCEGRPPRGTHATFGTQNFTFASSVSADSEFKLSSSSCVLGRLHHPPFLASLQLESNLNSESLLLGSPMASVHRRCMGCSARGGEPTYFNDYQSAATHYARSQFCSKSSREIKTVSVQLQTRPQYVGDSEAGGGGAAGAWRPQPAPSRRPGGNDIIEH